jgi:hypothetical protein
MSLGEMIEMEATTDEEDCHRDSSSPQSPSHAAVISKEREGEHNNKKKNRFKFRVSSFQSGEACGLQKNEERIQWPHLCLLLPCTDKS